MSTITKPTSGPLAGFASIDISQPLLAKFKQWCYDNHVPYQMGGKCSNPGLFPPTFVLNEKPCSGVDCSGFVRAILDYATSGGTAAMPDGSFMEGAWFAKMGFHSTEYANCGHDDNLLRVAIHKPNGRGGDATGHIWLICHGHTVESHGGTGPGERPWDCFLQNIVDECFVLGPLV